MVDCNQAEEMLVSHFFGILDSDERKALEEHLETCATCALTFQGTGETAAELALALPQLQVPPQVKERLFTRVDADLRPSVFSKSWNGVATSWVLFSHQLRTHSGKLVTSAIVFGLVFGGVMFNQRLNELNKDNEELAEELAAVSEQNTVMVGQIASVADKNEALSGQVVAVSRVNSNLTGQLASVMARESQAVEMIIRQRYFTYEALRMTATPGTTVNMLWGTGWSAQSRGMVMVSSAGTTGVLLAFDLPSLPADHEYKIWLIKDGQKYGVASFNVDSTGYGQAVIIPVTPFTEFEGIGITIEPTDGTANPTGTSVLKGDL